MSQMLNCHFEVQLEMSPVQLVLLNNLVYDAEVSAAASCPRGRRVTVVDSSWTSWHGTEHTLWLSFITIRTENIELEIHLLMQIDNVYHLPLA